jgi:N-terminal domain of galactosyltransferase
MVNRKGNALMSPLRPAERAVLSAAICDSLVIAADQTIHISSPHYWECGRSRIEEVVDAALKCSDLEIRSLAEDLIADPVDPAKYGALQSALSERGTDSSIAALYDLGWDAASHSRIGYHLGSAYTRGMNEITIEELERLPVPRPRASDPQILIVIPFQDRSEGRNRLRNLLACLLALQDQSVPRTEYGITVVESDFIRRWKDVIEPRVDHYIHAFNPRIFNKSWTVNAGVVNTPGSPEIVCILDADALVDRYFIERNAARFMKAGACGHLTYRDMLSLDSIATSIAIHERLWQRAGEANPQRLRGFLERRAPGCCVWVRSDEFYKVGGMDERYEGWGGEDYDFTHRFDLIASFDRYDDTLLHMYHPPSSSGKEDGGLKKIPPLSWEPVEAIGRLDRFRVGGG